MTEGEQMPETHDCGGEAAAYALGALEPADEQAFLRHLGDCAVCRDELDALQGVVRALPLAAPQHPVPKRLRRRVMGAIRHQPHPARARSPRPWTASGWPRLGSAAAAVAAAAVVAVAVVAGVELSSTSTPGRSVNAQVSAVSGTAELRVSGGKGELIVRHFSPPPSGQVYEVWLKSGDAAPVPASVLFSVTPAGNAEVGLPDSLVGVSQVMVTREPRGGSLFPTSPPVIVAKLS